MQIKFTNLCFLFIFSWFIVLIDNWLIQEMSSSVIGTSQMGSLPFVNRIGHKEGIPGELQPRTMPMTMNENDADTAAAICELIFCFIAVFLKHLHDYQLIKVESTTKSTKLRFA